MLNEYKPLSPWAYFGYTILFHVPVVGFICLIIFSFDNSNINRRNFARSYFCIYLLLAVVIIIMLLLGVSISSIIPNANQVSNVF